MPRYTHRQGPRRTAPRPLPRGTRQAAVAAALLIASLPAVAAGQAAEVPPAGAVTIVVLQSDGLAQLPVGIATIPPVACAPGGTP